MPAATTEKTIDIDALFQRRIRKVEIQIGDGTDDVFAVWYRPDSFTFEIRDRMNATENDVERAEALSTLIDKWSLTSKGAPYPITIDNLKALGIPLMTAILQVMEHDFTQNVLLGKATSTVLPEDSDGS